jgi:hypothetical protein
MLVVGERPGATSYLQAGHLPGTLIVMIPQADFDRAITQWKIRQQGGQVATQAAEEASGAVVGEMPLANAEPGFLSGEISSVEINSGPTGNEFDPES